VYIDGLKLNIGRNPTLSLLDIDKIIEKKAEYIRYLEEQSTLFENKLHNTRQRITTSEGELRDLLQTKRSVEIDLQWKSDLRDQLQRNGIAVDSITKLAEYAQLFTDRGFDINELIKTFSNYRRLQEEVVAEHSYVQSLRITAKAITDKNSLQEEVLQKNSLKVTELDAIKEMGFGLSELKRLYSRRDIKRSWLSHGRECRRQEVLSRN